MSDASLSLPQEQTFGLVGESGSGKTTLARMVAGLTPPTSGTVVFDSRELRATVGKRKRDMLRRLQMVFQNPDGSLNPRHTVRQELVRPLIRLGGLDRRPAGEAALGLLRAVRLPASYLDRYPGELSGGEKQRVAIARAFAVDPDLVLCDEPLSSLDVSVQGALMNLLVDLQHEEHTSYLFISHDIAAVQYLSHRIGVMYRGRLVEQGPASDVMTPPYHPYTEALLAAVPDPAVPPGPVRLRGLASPERHEREGGCPYHLRCPRSLGEVCATGEPPWRRSAGAETSADDDSAAAGDHAIRCHIPYEELRAAQRSAPAAPGVGVGSDEPSAPAAPREGGVS